VTIINNLDPGYPLLTNIRKQIYDLCLNVFSALDSCNYQTLELSFTEIASGIQVEINARDINFGQRINDISIKLHNIITKEPVNGEVIRVKSIKLEEKWISIVLS
jgi:ribonucleotide reductase beta subunit family protein with ferritin-like domain